MKSFVAQVSLMTKLDAIHHPQKSFVSLTSCVILQRQEAFPM